MERTESTVVQVAPDYENEKTQEMQGFGWNLQGRQEMREEGEAYGRPSLTGSSYIVTTKVSHYVKLHFIRSLDHPNLAEIKRLEAEYSNLPLMPPPSMKAAGCFTLFGVVGIIVMLVTLGDAKAPGIPGLLMMIVWSAIGVWWVKSKLKKRAEARAAWQSNMQRMAQLREQAATLL